MNLNIAVGISLTISESSENANDISLAIFEASEIAVSILLVMSQHIY